jgi:hypothetical protein
MTPSTSKANVHVNAAAASVADNPVVPVADRPPKKLLELFGMVGRVMEDQLGEHVAAHHAPSAATPTPVPANTERSLLHDLVAEVQPEGIGGNVTVPRVGARLTLRQRFGEKTFQLWQPGIFWDGLSVILRAEPADRAALSDFVSAVAGALEPTDEYGRPMYELLQQIVAELHNHTRFAGSD